MISFVRLSNRERQLAGLVALGKTNRWIATELHLSEGTVKEYLGRIYQKLLIHTRTELAVWAYGALPDSHGRMAAAGKGELFLQVLGEQDQCKEMALERK